MITPKLIPTLKFILKYRWDNGYSPTYREIATVNNGSISASYRRVVALMERGYIHGLSNKNRAIEPTKRALEWEKERRLREKSGSLGEN